MDKLFDIVRLILTTLLPDRAIARSLQVSKTTVGRYRDIIVEKGYAWTTLSCLEFQALHALFNRSYRRFTNKRIPDFARVHEEMQKSGVTLLLLWEEYRAINPDDALSYSQFTYYYRKYLRTLGLSMRQTHRPGERAFVDFSGDRPAFTDLTTGERIEVEMFVGAMGYSHYTFATCVLTQSLPDWIEANVQMEEFFGGSPIMIVPDNLRAAVACAGNPPKINRIYRDFARHYDTTILPARPRKPKDKAKVEVAVQLVQRWIIARLRNRTFFSLAELNAVVAELVHELNERPFKRLPGCRRSRFEMFDKPRLRPLPATRFEYAEWVNTQTVGNSYHILVQDHWYSVPYGLVGQSVDARVTSNTVEIFHQHSRIASHPRSRIKGGDTTDPNHQSDQHRAYAERTPQHFVAWAEKIGPNTLAVVRHQFNREFPPLGLPACDSLRKLVKQYGEERVEAAAKRAVEIKSLTVKSVKSLLGSGLYKLPTERTRMSTLPNHSNVRGPAYFAANGGR